MLSMSKMIERLKRIRIIRAIVYTIVGSIYYPMLVWVNKLKISGTEHLEKLPRENVLFVSNHQTYFADVIAVVRTDDWNDFRGMTQEPTDG